MTSYPRQDLRQLHAQQTRALILEAFAHCLEEREPDDVSVPDIAERAGISDRTVYRHFPTRVDLLAALTDWTRSNFISLIPLHDLDQLPDVVARAMIVLDGKPNLARALAKSTIGHDILSGLSASVREQVRGAVDRAFPSASESQRRTLLGALACLDSLQSWLILHDEFGMDADEIGATLGWAVKSIIDAGLPAAPDASPSDGVERTQS